jgi:hypothetical protein
MQGTAPGIALQSQRNADKIGVTVTLIIDEETSDIILGNLSDEPPVNWQVQGMIKSIKLQNHIHATLSTNPTTKLK